MPCNRCCSCYSFYFDFPACFDGESCFILRAVLQSHGQERNNHEFQSRTTTLELFPYIPWKPPLTLMIIPPFAEVFGKHKGRRKQLGSLAGWALLSFPHTGEDHHKEVSSAEVLHWCTTTCLVWYILQHLCHSIHGVPEPGALGWQALMALHPWGCDLQSTLKPFCTGCCCCHFTLAAPLMSFSISHCHVSSWK